MNDNGFKSDEDYGYHISLDDDRDYPEGHNSFDFNKTDTEVTALQKIFDQYFNTETLDAVAEFTNHKLDFGVSFFDVICLIMKEKMKDVNIQFSELENQLSDISHRMTPGLGGQTFTTEEKVEMFDLQQDLLNKRRNVKDVLTVMRVILENAEKSRNFIFGMNRRQYSAKSQRFSEDENYHYSAKDNVSDYRDRFKPTMVSVKVQHQTNE